jgi:iron complex transport system substrate-binding protein
MFKKIFFCFVIPIFCLCCHNRNRKTVENDFYLSDNEITIAHGLSIYRSEDFVKVTIRNPWQGASNLFFDHYLIPKGSPLPKGIDSSMAIFVPIEKIVCMSTTHASMILALGETNSIKGMSGANLAYSQGIIELVEQRQIYEVGYESNLNTEVLIKISPDLTMMYGIGNESVGHINKMKETGIKTMFNADYLATDPLGKAEWIKLFGELYCKRDIADSIFNSIADSYNTLKNHIHSNITHRPLILLGLPFKDTWFISPGNSFINTLINDAGGEYLWKETHSNVSMPYNLESVFIKAVNADYWLNIGTVEKASEISMLDKRLENLKCFANGRLYNNNKRVNKNGGNDFWESGALSPQIILNDIASILHPELFPEYTPYYYKKLNF